MKGSKCVADYFTSSNRRILTASQEINMRTDDDEDKYPGDEGEKKGTLRDRAVIRTGSVGVVPYWSVVDLIDLSARQSR
jgi:hypothetical protein